MTPHDHREYVPGCYRCELSRDEVEPACLGAPVWRWWSDTTLVTGKVITDYYYRDDKYPGESESHYPSEPGLWFATTPEATDTIWDRVILAIFDAHGDENEATANVLRALGFEVTDAE